MTYLKRTLSNRQNAYYREDIDIVGFPLGIVDAQPVVQLEGEVKLDEVYIVEGHKGNPDAVKKTRIGRRRRLNGDRGREPLEKETPPFFGIIQRVEMSI